MPVRRRITIIVGRLRVACLLAFGFLLFFAAASRAEIERGMRVPVEASGSLGREVVTRVTARKSRYVKPYSKRTRTNKRDAGGPSSRKPDPVKEAQAPSPAMANQSQVVQDVGVSAENGAANARNERRTDAELATIARTFCVNNAGRIAEAQLKARRVQLQQLEENIDRKSEALEKLVEEARSWIERRERVWASARDNLIEAYSKMRPEAAAQQIGAMNEEAGASILMKLNARAASAIMNEMGAERAARLADRALRKGSPVAPADKGGS